MGKHCVVQMTVTTVSRSYVSRMFLELFTLDGQEYFFDFEKKRGGLLAHPLVRSKNHSV
jgi:hypothetical protein